MALNVVSTDRLSTNVKTSNLATGLSSKVGESKNLIINGAFNVAQRGTSSTAGDGYNTVDRYRIKIAGTDESPTQAQHALTSSDTGPWAKGFRYSYHLTNGNQTSGAGAADVIAIQHRIEAQNVAQSGWDYASASSYVTLSFWVKSSVAQNFYGHVRTVDGTAQNYPFETGSLSADTWTKITKKIPGNSNIQVDNNNDYALHIEWVPFRGTDSTGSVSLDTWAAYSSATRNPDCTSTWYTTNDATFEITGVQLEVGDTATEFEHRSYHDELRRCQRYYFRIHPTATDDVLTGCAWTPTQATAQGITFFPVVMRARVTALEQSGTATDYQVSVGSGGATCSSVPTFNHGGVNAAATTFTCTGTPWNISNTTRPSNKTTDGFLAWSAEL